MQHHQLRDELYQKNAPLTILVGCYVFNVNRNHEVCESQGVACSRFSSYFYFKTDIPEVIMHSYNPFYSDAFDNVRILKFVPEFLTTVV